MSDIPAGIDTGTRPEVTPFFDAATNTISYVVKDPGLRPPAPSSIRVLDLD